jgi:hypothetical protein
MDLRPSLHARVGFLSGFLLFGATEKREIMDEPRTVLTVSSPELEEFFLDGTLAYQAETIQEQKSITSDLIGQVAEVVCDAYNNEGGTYQCAMPAAQMAWKFAARAGIDVARANLFPQYEGRGRLLGQLIFAARDLAHHTISHIEVDVGEPHSAILWTCRECKRSAFRVAPIQHRDRCRVGRVLRLLEQLCALDISTLISDEKEVAPAGEIGDRAPGVAGAGMRPRAQALYGEPWSYSIDGVLEETKILDREGTLIASIDKADLEAREWAARIMCCVNTLAGVPDAELEGGAR